MAVLSDLPLELRQAIWEECLRNDDDGEVYIFKPHCILGSYWRMDPNPTVNLKIPVIRHLCSESRQYAGERLRFRRSQATSEGDSAWVSMPERSYRPGIDVFYVPARYLRTLGQVLEVEDAYYEKDSIPFYCNISRLAMEIRQEEVPHFGEGWDILKRFVAKMPCLQEIRFVFDQLSSLGSVYEAGARYKLVDKYVDDDREASQLMEAFCRDLKEAALVYVDGQQSRNPQATEGLAFSTSATRLVKVGIAVNDGGYY